MTDFEVLVEEESIVPVSRSILPRLITERDSFSVRTFRGKPDLLRNLTNRLRGYGWRQDDFVVLVIVDRDKDDCKDLKGAITNFVIAAGMRPKGSRNWNVLTRIVVEELEAWFFGDWAAVCAAFPKVPRSVPFRAAYRDPDAIRGGTSEALNRVLVRAGYGLGTSKYSVAERIAPHMSVESNTSASFNVFCSGVAAAIRGER